MSTLLRGAERMRIASYPKSVPGRPSKVPLRSECVALSALCNICNRQFRGVECEITERSIVLRGTVSSFYEKQLAQEMVRTKRIGWAIVNTIEVVRGGESLLNRANDNAVTSDRDILSLCR